VRSHRLGAPQVAEHLDVHVVPERRCRDVGELRRGGLAERLGGTFAKGILDAHEEDSSVMFGFGTARDGNRCCDRIMDQYNKRVGIEPATQAGMCEEKALKALRRLRHSLCRE